MAAIRSRLPTGLRFRVGPRLRCSAPLWWRKGRPRTVHRSYAEVELLSRLAELLMPGEIIGELFRDFPVEKSELWGRPWLCPDISAFGVLKEEGAALFVEYDGCFRHSEPQVRQRDERKTEALLAYAPAGSRVLRLGHVGRGLRATDASIEATVAEWRAGGSSSLNNALHQATGILLTNLEGALDHEVRERLQAYQGAEPQPDLDKARKFVHEAVLTRDVETKKANMLAVLEGELLLSALAIKALENRFPSIWGVSIKSRLKPVVEWLERVGLRRKQVAKVVAVFPQVLGCSIDGNLKPTVAWLEDVGLSRQQVAKVVAGFPSVLGCSIDGNLKPTVAWLEDVGLSRQQVAKVVAGFPQMLGYSIDSKLKPTVAWLEDVGLSRPQVAKVVARFPQVLSCSIQNNLSPKLLLLQQFFSKEDICSMIVYLPQMLGLSYARLFHRLTMLQEHGCLYKLARVMALTDAKFARRFPTWHCRKVSTGGIVRAAARDGEVSINRVADDHPLTDPFNCRLLRYRY
eukprot:s8097_g2.t1